MSASVGVRGAAGAPPGEAATSAAVLPAKPVRGTLMTEEEIAALLEGAIQSQGVKARLDITALKSILAKIKAVDGIQVHAIVGETPAANKQKPARTAQTDAVATALLRIGDELRSLRSGLVPGAAPPTLAAPRRAMAAERARVALLGVAFVLMCCAAWLWFKTGDRPLALGSIVVANLVGCGLLFGRRSEP